MLLLLKGMVALASSTGPSEHRGHGSVLSKPTIGLSYVQWQYWLGVHMEQLLDLSVPLHWPHSNNEAMIHRSCMFAAGDDTVFIEMSSDHHQSKGQFTIQCKGPCCVAMHLHWRSPQHSTLQHSTTQCNARIDLDPILVFLCVAFLSLVAKSHECFELSKLDATQCMCPCVILYYFACHEEKSSLTHIHTQSSLRKICEWGEKIL